MASVGSFGDIDFYCKSINGKAKILSFYDLQRNSTANYAEHERNGEKSYLGIYRRWAGRTDARNCGRCKIWK